MLICVAGGGQHPDNTFPPVGAPMLVIASYSYLICIKTTAFTHTTTNTNHTNLPNLHCYNIYQNTALFLTTVAAATTTITTTTAATTTTTTTAV
jgi:hypothetical protein